MITVPEVKRKKGESFEGFFRRFGRRLQQSGRKLEVGKKRFYGKKPTKNDMQRAAVRRLEIQDKRNYLDKIGRLPEDNRKRGRRPR